MSKKKRATKPERERRVYSAPITVRALGNKKLIRGTAAVFAPKRSADLGGWFEEIDRHAFDKSLASPTLDVLGLWNHSTDHVLGRSTSGTLRLSTTASGLQYEIDPPNTGLANDLIELMERGDIHQSSFAFICYRDSWREENGVFIRTVVEAELLDVSPVTVPAYPDATSGYRASLRNAPDALRAKAKRDDLDDDDDDDPACDPESPDYDPDAECDDGENSRKSDPELDVLRMRLQIAQHRAKRLLSR